MAYSKDTQMKDKITTTYFITEIEKAHTEKLISDSERKTLLRDMLDILDKASENGVIEYLTIRTFRIGTERYLDVSSNNYDVTYRGNGRPEREFWMYEKLKHRGGGKPASIRYYENGNKKMEHWFHHGEAYRKGDKETVVHYYENGEERTTERHHW